MVLTPCSFGLFELPENGSMDVSLKKQDFSNGKFVLTLKFTG
jgi:hypothetical protein